MKILGTKLLVTPTKQENEWNYEDKEAAKHGTVAFPFKGEKIELKRGNEIYYQYSNLVKIEGIEYDLVSESNIICQK